MTFWDAWGRPFGEMRREHVDFSDSPEQDSSANRDLNKEDLAQDIILKRRLFTHVLWITYGWLSCLWILIFTSGMVNCFCGREFVSDTVLIALVSGTSLSVIIGMVSIILRHLFGHRARVA